MVALARTCVRLVAGCVLALYSVASPTDGIETLVMPGKVIQGHAKFEKDCAKCHEPFKKTGQNRRCLDCHTGIARNVASLAGLHGRLDAGRACRECHTDHKGRNARIVQIDEASFDHALTNFLLLGKHAGVKCRDCHASGRKHSEAPSACVVCHRKDDTHRGTLGSDCASCHAEEGWKKLRFDHAKTRFALTGLHARVKCEACHRNTNFRSTPRECAACHRKDDVHKGSLGVRCESCHTGRGWKAALFDHAKTGFPLLGAHGVIRCLACHKSPTFHDTPPQACANCHSRDDVHKGRFGEKCGTCHTETKWKTLRFDHDRDTKFALRDAHRSVKCDACHQAPLYQAKTPTTCNGCHAKRDVHQGVLGDRCNRCHLDKSWKSTRFDHARDTNYPLIGRHANTACKACHVDGTFRKKLGTDCLSCHRKDDVHAGQEGARCESCHDPSSWKKVRFDHAQSRFPLTGIHLTVACGKCHSSQKFKSVSMTCVSCHTKSDIHGRRLGTACDVCHNARDWRIWDFDHAKRTDFALDGAHRKVACVACHTRPGDKVISLSGRCIACHERDDVHREALGTNCERCHLTSSFKELRSSARSGAR